MQLLEVHTVVRNDASSKMNSASELRWIILGQHASLLRREHGESASA